MIQKELLHREQPGRSIEARRGLLTRIVHPTQRQSLRHLSKLAHNKTIAQPQLGPEDKPEDQRHQCDPAQKDKPAAPTALRSAVLRTITAAGALLPTGIAHALKQVELDGKLLDAYEFNVDLRVVALRGSMPQSWVSEFSRALTSRAKADVSQRSQLNDIFAELANPKKRVTAAKADAATLGDEWLAPAIRQGLVQPIPGAHSYRWWEALSPRWQALVRRDREGRPHPQGQVWACPYRWGCTLIAYRKSALLRQGGRPIKDWGDLLQPQLAQRVGFIDSPRELVGAALKVLGMPYNADWQSMAAHGITEADLHAAVNALCRQVRLFSSREHTRALEAKDVTAVVGWSGDLIPMAARSGDVVLVAPLSGTALWADCWTVPAHAIGGADGRGPSPLLPEWLAFGLQPARQRPSLGLQFGASPLLLPDGPMCSISGWGPEDAALELAPQQLPDTGVLCRSEFLLPLDDDMAELYARVLRQGQ